MVLTLEQLQKILASGGGLRLSASGYSLSQLTALAGAAASGRAMLQLADASSLTSAHLELLASTAPEYISFDLVKPVPELVSGIDL